jgi:hypothetical protein
MDGSTTSLAAQNEIQFLLSLLRISYPGQPAPHATDVIEHLLPAPAIR